MRILACFLLCSMMGGVSEILFLEVRNFFRSKLGRAARTTLRGSGSTAAEVSFTTDGLYELKSAVEAPEGERT